MVITSEHTFLNFSELCRRMESIWREAGFIPRSAEEFKSVLSWIWFRVCISFGEIFALIRCGEEALHSGRFAVLPLDFLRNRLVSSILRLSRIFTCSYGRRLTPYGYDSIQSLSFRLSFLSFPMFAYSNAKLDSTSCGLCCQDVGSPSKSDGTQLRLREDWWVFLLTTCVPSLAIH